MSLLTLCQNIAREAGYPAPSTIVSNTDQIAVRLLAAAQKAGKVLAKKDWTVLQKEYTFPTVAATASYAFPADFDRFMDQTQWNRATRERVMRTNPQLWQADSSGFIVFSVNDRFRVKADSGAKKFFIKPTPESVETIAFEYLSNQWCKSSGGTAQSSWLADTDTGILDEFLLELETLWRFKMAAELPYAEEKAEAERHIEMAYSRDGGAKVLRMGGPRFIVGAANIPETGVGQ